MSARSVAIVVAFQDGRIAGERIYWDHATVLRQVGLLPGEGAAAAQA